MTNAVAQPHALDEDELASFERDGFLIRRGVIPEETIADLRQQFADVVDRLAEGWFEEGIVTSTYRDLPFETRYAALRRDLPPKFPTSWRRVLASDSVYRLWQLQQLLGPARSLVGDEVYAHGIFNGRPREPGTPVQKVLWHQDAHYYKHWDASDGTLVSMWLPLVPVDATSGCLQLIPGSHRRGWVERIEGWNGLFTVPDNALEDAEPYTAEMAPGDVLMFSDVTLHQSLDNHSDHVRWSIDIRFGSATPDIIDKSPRGYYCFSAADPSRVEPYETWIDRFDYSRLSLRQELEKSVRGDRSLDELAAELHVSKSELELF